MGPGLPGTNNSTSFLNVHCILGTVHKRPVSCDSPHDPRGRFYFYCYYADEETEPSARLGNASKATQLVSGEKRLNADFI